VNPAAINEEHPQSPTWFGLTPSQFESFRKAKSIDDVIGFALAGLTATDNDLPEDVRVAYVTSNASVFFGVPAQLGRGIQPFDAAKGTSAIQRGVTWKAGYGSPTLSLVGIASTVSFAIARRTKEVGVRMALGAQRSHTVWIVARATLATVASGVVVGLLLHLALEQAPRHWAPASAPTPWVPLTTTQRSESKDDGKVRFVRHPGTPFQ
jgi:hypothetical protein